MVCSISSVDLFLVWVLQFQFFSFPVLKFHFFSKIPLSFLYSSSEYFCVVLWADLLKWFSVFDLFYLFISSKHESACQFLFSWFHSSLSGWGLKSLMSVFKFMLKVCILLKIWFFHYCLCYVFFSFCNSLFVFILCGWGLDVKKKKLCA